MDNAIAYKDALKLSVGVALSAYRGSVGPLDVVPDAEVIHGFL